MFRCSLDELNAGVQLPVSHRLLEERPVRTAEIGLDLVGYYTVLPQALRSGGGSSSISSILHRRLDACLLGAFLFFQLFVVIAHAHRAIVDRPGPSFWQVWQNLRPADTVLFSDHIRANEVMLARSALHKFIRRIACEVFRAVRIAEQLLGAGLIEQNDHVIIGEQIFYLRADAAALDLVQGLTQSEGDK